MNMVGALLFLAIILALFLYTREQRLANTPDLAMQRAESAALQEQITAKRTTLAVFDTISHEIEAMQHTKEIYEREIRELDEEYQEKVVRNARLDEVYGAFSEAWKASEQA